MYNETFDGEKDMIPMKLSDETLEKVSGGKRVMATGNLSVRIGPGMGFAVIGHTERGSILTYAGATETDEGGVKWYSVSFGVNCGWVCSRYSRKL